jgi:hypothetical protein
MDNMKALAPNAVLSKPYSAADIITRDQYQKSVEARLSWNGPPSIAPTTRFGRRHTPARHDPHARRHQGAQLGSVRMLLQVHDELGPIEAKKRLKRRGARG